MDYFSEPYGHGKTKTKFELYFSNYGTKSHLKNATGFNTSKFAKKTDLASLK